MYLKGLIGERRCYRLEDRNSKKAVQDKFTEIYDSYKSAIYKFCLARLGNYGDRAEDCMQNAFIVLYRRMLNNEQIDNPRAFLYKTAHNFVMKCYDEITRENNTIVPLSEHQDKAVDDQSRIDSDIDYELLNKRLNAVLTPDEQRLLKLKYIDDLMIEQIADLLGVSKPAVAKRLQRLREKIRNSVQTEYTERKGG